MLCFPYGSKCLVEFLVHSSFGLQVKNRWAGKTIVDLFTDEFKGRSREYYVCAVKRGRLQVDEQSVHTDYIVKSSQKISHFVHRHEPPVLAGDITILKNEVDVVTICKPASVPVSLFSNILESVHPCGQYRKNTVVGILQAEYGLTPLFRILCLSVYFSCLYDFDFYPL
ncbi:hypothetical protein PR202_ga01513 [Eleusine coracana subsp. coracana]|uniref:Uncharacterized protein n=1 Tax=Eleusine coracana subsp. coracana TaxID=191504 RepID=A0AAV5BJ45_ELECO|nr:hypothetical protein PR202_ga00826 [Eleusine coracana subsp. coracana]GJM85720.1 hypothetical protein PR202_ga01513 [Eleusine coracana subsp. coracana]